MGSCQSKTNYTRVITFTTLVTQLVVLVILISNQWGIPYYPAHLFATNYVVTVWNDILKIKITSTFPAQRSAASMNCSMQHQTIWSWEHYWFFLWQWQCWSWTALTYRIYNIYLIYNICFIIFIKILYTILRLNPQIHPNTKFWTLQSHRRALSNPSWHLAACLPAGAGDKSSQFESQIPCMLQFNSMAINYDPFINILIWPILSNMILGESLVISISCTFLDPQQQTIQQQLSLKIHSLFQLQKIQCVLWHLRNVEGGRSGPWDHKPQQIRSTNEIIYDAKWNIIFFL